MSITVKPDPDHPLGGHALIVVRGRVAQGPVTVSVTDLFEDRHLGPKGWQQAPVALGPYAAHDEGDAVVVPVGPEVVDQIPEFASLRLSVAGVSAELAWPDTIRMSPRRAPGSQLDGKVPEKPRAPEPKPEPKVEPEPEPGPVEVVDPVPPKPRSPLPLILAALLLLAAAAGGAWWYLNQPSPVIDASVEPPPAPPPAPPSPPVISPPPTDTAAAPGCDAPGLTAAAALAPAEAFAAVARCGAQGDAEQRFRIIDSAATAGVGEAIAMIGRWYDPAEAAAVGSNFTSRDVAQAARYYKDAVAAGYADAAPLLARACAALNPDTDPTHEIARELYCPSP